MEKSIFSDAKNSSFEPPREELKIHEEIPIVINDYTKLNDWEKLISIFETIISNWNLLNKKPDPNNENIPEYIKNPIILTESIEITRKSYSPENFKISYISLPYKNEPNFKHYQFPYVKYYNEGHNNLFILQNFSSLPNEDFLIPLLFGVQKFIKIETMNQSSYFNNIEILRAKEILSALQIAVQHSLYFLYIS